MRELDLTTDEAIEYAKLNSNVVQPSRRQINPYYLGIKIFEVREIESDQSFIRNYLTKELVNREDLFLFERKGNEVVVSSKD